MWPDLTDQVCLITGGTRGIGLAAGLELARHGAQVVLTYKWGSHDDAEIEQLFHDAGGKAPLVLNADAASEEDVLDTIQTIKSDFGRFDLFVSNVGVAARGGSIEALRKRDLATSLKVSVVPLSTHIEAAETMLGKPPARVIAMSSDGPDAHIPQYDYVAVVKAALEEMARQHARNGTHEPKVFILRSRQIVTESFSEMFSAEARALLTKAFSDFEILPGSVGRAVVALASGSLDALSGKTLTVDRGAAFLDNTLTVAPTLLEAYAEMSDAR